MKKLFAFILLLSHINTSMFFPVVEEHDLYTSSGVQLDDINSVLEFVVKKLSHQNDKHSTDEDDDQPDFFMMVKTNSYVPFNQLELVLVSYPAEGIQHNSFYEPHLTSVTKEITTPPPDNDTLLHI